MSTSLQPHGLYSPWNSPGQNTELGSLSLLQGIFPTQGLNPDPPHHIRILYQLSRKGSPRILEWVAYPFSSGSSQPRNPTGVSCIVGRFFTNWAMREATFCYSQSIISILFKFIPLPLTWALCGSIFLTSLPVPLSMWMGQYLSHMVLKFLQLVLCTWPFLDRIKEAPKQTWVVSACCQQMATGIMQGYFTLLNPAPWWFSTCQVAGLWCLC